MPSATISAHSSLGRRIFDADARDRMRRSEFPSRQHSRGTQPFPGRSSLQGCVRVEMGLAGRTIAAPSVLVASTWTAPSCSVATEPYLRVRIRNQCGRQLTLATACVGSSAPPRLSGRRYNVTRTGIRGLPGRRARVRKFERGYVRGAYPQVLLRPQASDSKAPVATAAGAFAHVTSVRDIGASHIPLVVGSTLALTSPSTSEVTESGSRWGRSGSSSSLALSQRRIGEDDCSPAPLKGRVTRIGPLKSRETVAVLAPHRFRRRARRYCFFSLSPPGR